MNDQEIDQENKKKQKYDDNLDVNDDSSLPKEWSKYYDEEQECYYYHNSITGQSQWTKPNIQKSKSIIKNILKNNSQIVPMNNNSEKQKFQTKQTTNEPEDDSSMKQDYISLSKIYEVQKPYRDYTATNVVCILCHQNTLSSVLYPCQHRCVCNQCIKSEIICSVDEIMRFPQGHCNCPLCGTIIKKILPVEENGHDEITYWNWVLEVKPPLPDDFMKNFKHSAAIIQKVHIDENIKQRNKKKSKSYCIIL